MLEVVLSTADDIEIRPYTGGFVAMTGDGTAGHADWPHIGVALMQPRARGRITLASRDPGVPPRIEHRYDSEPDDVAVLHRGAELARELVGTTTYVGGPYGLHRNIFVVLHRWAPKATRGPSLIIGAGSMASRTCG